MIFRYEFGGPSSDTLSITPIRHFVDQYLGGVSVDPFARDCELATYRNDLDPATKAEYHMDAVAFLEKLSADGVKADTVIYDPPYSPRQISECYQGVGLTVGMKDTQNAVLYANVRKGIKGIAKPGTVVLSFGWNSLGMGKFGWERIEILLVNHGAAHNDTICVADRCLLVQPSLFEENA